MLRKLRKKPKINLLLLVQDAAAIGGAEIFLTSLVREFISSSVKVTTVSAYQPFLKMQKRAGAKTILVPYRLDIIGGWKGMFKFFFQTPWAIYWYGRLLIRHRRDNGDIVLISGFSDKIVATPLALFLRLPVVWIEHGPLGEVFKRNFGVPKLFYQLVKNLPKLVITPSLTTRRSFVKETHLTGVKLKKIFNGIEILSSSEVKFLQKRKGAIRKKLDIPADSEVIGVVSRLQKEKGQDILIGAVPFILKSQPKAKIVIVGEGDDITRLNRLAKRLKVSSSILFLGFRKDLYEVLSSFDVFVFPTVWKLEGFGIAPVEAMMLEIPVVASNFGPIPEVVDGAGLLFDPGDPYKLSIIVKKLLNDNRLRCRIGKRGRERVVKYFDIKKTAKDYIKEFERIIKAYA